MARAIDGDALLDELKKEIAILKETPGKDDYDKGIIQGYKEAITHLKVSPTLTPQNELVEALEAINNAAVAYIEGGPYENDLPGLEFAMEIDRLSQDFVRPPEGEEDNNA